MERTLIKDLKNQIGKKVLIKGWAETIRNHGNLIFIDLREATGLIQTVFFQKDLVQKAAEINTQDLLEIEGLVQKRPDKTVNPDLDCGDIELAVENFSIISKSAALPFLLENTQNIDEAQRLKYRYLDLRTSRMQNNLKKRHEINLFLRNYLSNLNFTEIETPFLSKGTPEGSREFIVPSRLHAGQFYVLPQSPQQYKQLLMVAGLEKYFQITRCFRDEDQRGDRQPEFTQLDLEMSFVKEEDVITLTEQAIIALVKSIFPDLKIDKIPFPRLTYQESMEKYKTDKPDLRSEKDDNLLSFCWIIDFPLFEKKPSETKISSCHHPFTRPKKEDLGLLEKDPLKVRAEAYDLVLNGNEIGGGSIRIHEKELQEKIFDLLGLTQKEISERFGHLIDAFKFSPPPHGGIALGLDRLISLLLKEKNIREVIAFPKTGDAKDLLFGAPTSLSEKTLKEVHIKL